MTPLFGSKYDDEKIAQTVEQALTHQPTVDTTKIQPIVDEGVIRLSGTVTSELMKQRVVDTVRERLEVSGIEYDRLDDELVVA